MATTLTATQAAKQFATMLDDLEHGHESLFYVERHGKRIARIEAAPEAPRGVTWGAVVGALTDGPPPDADFADDIALAHRTMVATDEPWGGI